MRETAIVETTGAKSGALGAREAPMDPSLAAVVDAWPTLSEPIRAGILAVVTGYLHSAKPSAPRDLKPPVP